MSLKSVIAFLFIASASLAGAQTLQTLVFFNGSNGAEPGAALTLGNDGNFYGTASDGGSGGYGTVFRVTTNGTLTTLYNFSGTDGKYPEAALTLGNDGNFYGTTWRGGSSGYGTVFQVTTNGTLTTLVSFNVTNGANPQAALTLGTDGNFYGTTSDSFVSAGNGTVFKVTINGTLTTLVSFNGNNGATPGAALSLGTDGNFYGTTYGGGSSGVGTVFRMTTNGTLTTLVSFSGNNGANPEAALTHGTDGNFYSTTDSGGSGNYGTVFKVTTNGTLTTLVSFTASVNPNALTLGSDGNFYGTTDSGGIASSHFPSGMGTVFQVTTNGALTTLVSFNGNNGANPESGSALTLGTDGNFYGTTYFGGSGSGFGNGTVFRLLLPPVITVQPQSQVNIAGATVTFLVIATSLQPLGYQWQKNGTNLVTGGNISVVNTNAITITSISDGDAATYSVIVSNANFSVTNYATLTVIDPPSITAQPTNLLVFAGNKVAFSVSPNASAPLLYYQWQFNGTNIFNATNANCVIGSVATNNAGNYSVVVSNLAGTVASSNAALSVILSPTSRTNDASTTATFTATAFSPERLNFQWQKEGTNLVNGGNISGATNSTLTVANVQDADAAIYSAVVSDAFSSVTTSNATLTVIDPPIITSQPSSLVVLSGTNAAFGISLTGTAPLNYQWQFDGTNILNATDASFAIVSILTNNAGNYSVIVTNAAGSVTSSNAALTVVLSPTSQMNSAGSMATFTVTAFGPELLNYQWQKNGTNLVNSGNIAGATNSILSIANLSDADAANYSAVVSDAYNSVTSSIVTLTVIDPPIITSQPLSRTNNAGTTATFTVTANGTAPAYQWLKGTLPISGAVLATLTLTNVQDADMAGYTVVLTNAAGSATSAPPATLTVIDPPFITVQPLSRTNNAGSTATFTVTANGTTPAYQWFKGSLAVSGAVLATLTLTNVQATDVAGYTVVLTNAAGSATSAPPATLTVIDPPIITAQPSSLVVLPGTNVAFGVSLSGSAPYFRYQWQFNGTNLLNATNALYTISGVATNKAGNYSVMVTNAAGRAVSSNAALSVVLSPKSQTNYAGSTISFVVTAFTPESLSYQWQKNGTNLLNGGNISGANTNALTITWISVSDGASYSVIVSDSYSSVTSSVAKLTVIPPRLATGRAITTNGFFVGVTLTDSGSGYTNAPLVRIIGGGGSGAQAVAVVSNGVVVAIQVLNAGSGYTNAPQVVIEPPFIFNPVLGIAPMSFLTFSNLTMGGSYQLQRSVAWYWTNQPVSFTAAAVIYTQMVAGVAGGGDYRLALNPVPSQAFARPQVVNGFVVGATVTSGGSGYVTSPAVSIVGGRGTNATAVSQISGGVVTNILITSAGFGYTNTPTVQIAQPPAAAVSPTVLPVMRLDSASLAPLHNYQIQFRPDIGGTWEDWGGGLFSPVAMTNSQFLFITNGMGFFRMQFVP